MTLPTTGAAISISQVSVEIGSSATVAANMSFLNGLIKPAQRPTSPNMDKFYLKAWFQKNNEGNCNNGNAGNCDCNCGNIQCTNCVNCNAINCTNCDAQNYLQVNCNCACTYNCNSNEVSYNCDCDCACAC
jgi:hypothetical protein